MVNEHPGAASAPDERILPEIGRIRFLLERDGYSQARLWVERTLTIYRAAVRRPQCHASLPEYRSRFEAAILAFSIWLAGDNDLS